jgi:lysozyme
MNRRRVYEQLIIDEGVKHEIYLDHLGNPTFGIGHLITEKDKEHDMPVGATVSGERIWDVFNDDLNIAIDECKHLYGYSEWEFFPAEVQEVLVNMMFNLGRPRLSKFKNMNASLIKHDWRIAAVHGRDSLWYKQVTNRAERLMTILETVS